MHVYLPEVPHFPQTRDGTCLEARVCIVLAYLESPVTEEKVSDLFAAESEETVWIHDSAFDEAPQHCLIDSFLAAWIEMDETAAIINL